VGKEADVQFVPVHLSNLNRILPRRVLAGARDQPRRLWARLKLEEEETKESFLRKAHAAVCALREA